MVLHLFKRRTPELYGPKWCPVCATKREWKDGVREDCTVCAVKKP